MKTYEIMRCRRQALGLTKEKLAEKTELDPKLIEFYEDGKNTPSYVETKIRMTLMKIFQDMDPMTHYKRRILELALELNSQDEVKFALLEIGHMIIELGKMQMDMMAMNKV